MDSKLLMHAQSARKTRPKSTPVFPRCSMNKLVHSGEDKLTRGTTRELTGKKRGVARARAAETAGMHTMAAAFFFCLGRLESVTLIHVLNVRLSDPELGAVPFSPVSDFELPASP